MPSVTTTSTVSSSGVRLMRKTSCTGTNDQANNSSFQHNPDRKSLRDQPNVGKYKLIRTLGRGNFAKVKLAQHVSTGREVAVKVIDKTQLNQASLKKLFREVNIMKMLNHPNIVRLYEVIESERHVYLVMEYAENGEVFDHLVAHGRMKEREARAAFRQIVSAVEYCHQKKIVHRDLKAENLLFDGYFNIKLADFGFSNLFDGSKKLDTFCGSPPYAAPELFQGRKYDGPEVDVWSLGVILYTLVSGSLPFDAQHLKDLQERVLRGKYRVPFYMSTDCEALLRKLLVLNPAKRVTLRNVMSDKWLNIGYEDNILKPYTEPPPDYNDTERLEIMRIMGYRPDDVREALIKQSFNNVTAIYLLLADPKTRLTLPAGSLFPSNQSQSLHGNTGLNHHHQHHRQSSCSEGITIAASSTPATVTEDETTTSSKGQSSLDNPNGNNNSNNKQKTNQNGLTYQNKKESGQDDSGSQYNGVRRISGISWMKQSASAGPTANRQEKSSVDEKSHLLPRIRVSDLRERANDSNLDDSSGQEKIDESKDIMIESSSGGDQLSVRRMNTFSMSDKVRPNGSDSQSPGLKCPLSRAPPMSNIPNSLTTPTTSSSENSPIKQSADKSSSSASSSSSSPSKQNGNEQQTIKLNPAVPYSEENPFIGWLRRTLPYRKKHKDTSIHSKPKTTTLPITTNNNNNTINSSNKVPSNDTNSIIDILHTNDRQKHQQSDVNRPSIPYSLFNINKTKKSKKLSTNQSDDHQKNNNLNTKIPESFTFTDSHSSTMDPTSSSGTMNSAKITQQQQQNNKQSSSPSGRIALPDSIFKALDTLNTDEKTINDDRKKSDSKSHGFKLPTTTASLKRDSIIKWSVRHRPNNTMMTTTNNIPSIAESKQVTTSKKNVDPNQNINCSTELKNYSDSSMTLETPSTTVSKNGSSSHSRPGRFFRSLTLRIARSHTNHHNNRIISSIQKSNHKYTNNTNFKPHRMSLLKPNNNEAELTEELNSSNRLHCSSLTHSTSSSPTTSSHPSTTQQQQHHHHDNDEVNCDDDDDDNDDTMKCLVSINPDPWITMEPGKQQRKDLISKCKRSLSSELDTNKLKQHPNPLHYYPYHHGIEFPTNNNTSANNQSIAAGCGGGGGGYQKKTGVEPCYLDPPTSKTVVITSDMHKLKASTITTPSCTISLSPSSSSITTTTTTSSPLTVTTRIINWKTTTSSSQLKSSDEHQHDHHTFYYGKNENQKLWKPRRLHFVLRLPIIGTDPHVLLIQIIELIKRYQCSYEFLSSYRIRCTKLMNPSSSSSHQSSPCSNHNNNNNTIDDVDVDQQLEHCTLTTSPQQQHPQQQKQRQQQQPQLSYLIHLKHKTNLIIWDMEIFQLAKPINYGVRFKRISGNRNAFNIIMKYFILHTTNIT